MSVFTKHRKCNNYLGNVVPIGWHVPTYSEMYYILNTRSNASNLRTLGRIDINGNGTYLNGFFLLPDDWLLPAGISMTITLSNFTDNTYSLEDFGKLEENGVVFLKNSGFRSSSNYSYDGTIRFSLSNQVDSTRRRILNIFNGISYFSVSKSLGLMVRLCRQSFQPHTFSTSATSAVEFSNGNVQYHCNKKEWRFAEHQYDFIGADNANIAENYDGWIDLFGFGTSGVIFSPTLHTTVNSDYASVDLLGTPNDWGVNF